MSRLTVILAMALLLLVGCGQQSPQETLRTELQTVKSNAATAEMVARSLANGDVPQPYASNSIKSAQTNVQGSVEKLLQLPETGDAGSGGDSLASHLKAIQTNLGKIAESVEKNERAALLPLADQLASEEQALDDIAEKMGLEL